MADTLNLGYSNIYFGRKGGGKTQQAVIDAYHAYKEGNLVISNIWLNFPHIRFHDSPSLVPILKEIAKYCNDYVMAIEAPLAMLKEYKMVRKTGKVGKFFILFDEIGNHLNARNWQRNFKAPILRDMLTEPRKYKLTIVGICQSYKDVDIAFLRSCEDWFLFSKSGKSIFERMKYTHFWVINGELNFNEQYILDSRQKFVYFWKVLILYRSLYWTGEIVGTGVKENIPHQFKEGQIYFPSPDSDPLPDSVFLLDKKVSEKGAKANMGERESAGASPTNNFTSVKIPQYEHVGSDQTQKENTKKAKRGRPRKSSL